MSLAAEEPLVTEKKLLFSNTVLINILARLLIIIWVLSRKAGWYVCQRRVRTKKGDLQRGRDREQSEDGAGVWF